MFMRIVPLYYIDPIPPGLSATYSIASAVYFQNINTYTAVTHNIVNLCSTHIIRTFEPYGTAVPNAHWSIT